MENIKPKIKPFRIVSSKVQKHILMRSADSSKTGSLRDYKKDEVASAMQRVITPCTKLLKPV